MTRPAELMNAAAQSFTRRQAVKAIAGMRCDGGSLVLIGCLKPVKWGVRVHVPSRTQNAPGHTHLRWTLDLHVCEDHRNQGAFKLDDLLDAKLKHVLEDAAKALRPIDFRCDFDAAFIDYIDVFSPLYARYAAAWEGKAQELAAEALRSPVWKGGA